MPRQADVVCQLRSARPFMAPAAPLAHRQAYRRVPAAPIPGLDRRLAGAAVAARGRTRAAAASRSTGSVRLRVAHLRSHALGDARAMGGRLSGMRSAGPPAPEGPAAPSGTISVESGLAETLSAQRQSRLVDEQQKALEAEVERRVTVATAERVLAASAAWESERRGLLEARERELREAEASQLDHVKAQVALLHSKYDFVRPPPVPRCLAEERDVLKCYEDNKGGDVLKCAKLVDAYSACARRVADDLARSLQQS